MALLSPQLLSRAVRLQWLLTTETVFDFSIKCSVLQGHLWSKKNSLSPPLPVINNFVMCPLCASSVTMTHLNTSV